MINKYKIGMKISDMICFRITCIWSDDEKRSTSKNCKKFS